MKLFILAAMLFSAAAVHASDSTELFRKADELTAQKKYNSAFKLLSENDGKGTKSDVVVKEADIALKYFAQSIMHQAFGFVDLEPGQTIEDVRGKPGSYSLYQLPLDKILGELIAKEPKNASLYYCLGTYYYEVLTHYSGQWALSDAELRTKARDNLLKSRELGTSDAASLSIIGFAYLSDDDFKKASAFLGESLKLDPSDVNCRYNLSYARYCEKDYAASLDLASKSFDGYTDKVWKADAAKLAGNCCLQTKKYADASAWFRKGIALYPDDYFTHNGLLQSCISEGKDNDAAAAADAMFAQHPTFPKVADLIAENYLRAGKKDELDSFFTRSIAKYSDSEVKGNLYFHQATFYLDTEEKEKAKPALVSARECFAKAFKKDHPVFGIIDEALKSLE